MLDQHDATEKPIFLLLNAFYNGKKQQCPLLERVSTHIAGLTVVVPVREQEGEDLEWPVTLLHCPVGLLAARHHCIEVRGDRKSFL